LRSKTKQTEKKYEEEIKSEVDVGCDVALNARRATPLPYIRGFFPPSVN
jgi:hypothetical protein